jgi:UPI00016E0F9B related cluster
MQQFVFIINILHEHFLSTGIPVDKLNEEEGISQEIKNSVARRILLLCLREIFIFKTMQTDPNWSNFLYEPQRDIIHLLDFGASRTFSDEFVGKYLDVIDAAAKQDREKVLTTSQDLKFLTGYESKLMKDAHVDAVMILGEAFSFDGKFDFGKQKTIEKITNLIPILLQNRLTPPPIETYSLHRKTSGIFLLCSKLEAKVNCKKLFDQVCQEYFALEPSKSTL